VVGRPALAGVAVTPPWVGLGGVECHRGGGVGGVVPTGHPARRWTIYPHACRGEGVRNLPPPTRWTGQWAVLHGPAPLCSVPRSATCTGAVVAGGHDVWCCGVPVSAVPTHVAQVGW
jgi:hypothetical protein